MFQFRLTFRYYLCSISAISRSAQSPIFSIDRPSLRQPTSNPIPINFGHWIKIAIRSVTKLWFPGSFIILYQRGISFVRQSSLTQIRVCSNWGSFLRTPKCQKMAKCSVVQNSSSLQAMYLQVVKGPKYRQSAYGCLPFQVFKTELCQHQRLKRTAQRVEESHIVME